MAKNKDIVYIKRKSVNTNVPKELLINSRSQWMPAGANGVPRTGLKQYEKEVLLPLVLSIPAKHVDFELKVNAWYNDLNVNIPYGRGLALNLATSGSVPVERIDDEDVTKKVTETVAMPLSPKDYLIYRAMLVDREVANSKEESEGNLTAKYFVYDERVENKIEYTLASAKDKAYATFLKIKDKPEVVNDILTVYGKNVDNMEPEDKEMALRDIATLVGVEGSQSKKDALKRFDDLANDPDIDIRVMLRKGINKKAIVAGSSGYVLTMDDINVSIGNSESEAVAWLKDSKNSKNVVMLKAFKPKK